MRLLNRIRAFFTLLIGSIRTEAKNLIEPAIQFTQTLKNVVDNPALDVAVSLTKTPIDNEILKKLRTALPGVIKKLILLQDADKKKPTELIKLFVELVRTYPTDGRAALYFKLTSLLVAALDKDYSQSERDLLVQAVYVDLKSKEELSTGKDLIEPVPAGADDNGEPAPTE